MRAGGESGEKFSPGNNSGDNNKILTYYVGSCSTLHGQQGLWALPLQL